MSEFSVNAIINGRSKWFTITAADKKDALKQVQAMPGFETLLVLKVKEGPYAPG